MSDLSYQDVMQLDCEQRYDTFLTQVAEEREVWILLNSAGEFLKIHSLDDDFEYLPLWPSAEFARAYSEGGDEVLSPKAIAAPEFFTKWVPGLTRDELKVGILPSSGKDVWVMEPAELKSELQDEFSRF